MVGGDFERRVAGASRRVTNEEWCEHTANDSESRSEVESRKKTGVEYRKSAAKRKGREPLDDQRFAYHTFRGIVPSGPKRDPGRRMDVSSQATKAKVSGTQSRNQRRRKKRKYQKDSGF